MKFESPDREVIHLPSPASSYRLTEMEWTDSRLVLSSLPTLKLSILLIAIVPMILLPISLFIGWLEGDSLEKGLSFISFVAPFMVGIQLIIAISVIVFHPYCILELDASEDRIALKYCRLLTGQYRGELHMFSRLTSVTMHETSRHIHQRGIVRFLAVRLYFPQNVATFQSVNSVEKTKQHGQWIAEVRQRL